LMVGLMQWGMGVARLGSLVRFLSHPVIAGFTSAAALIIGASQLKHVLGVPLPRSHRVHEILLAAAARLGEADPATVALSMASVAALVALKRWAPRSPRFLLVVAAGALAVWGLGLDARGVAVVGAVPAGLPGFEAPAISAEAVVGLLPIAITIALVSFMESISVAKAFARANGYALRADQELIALGLANVGGAFFQAYPVTGGFSRTAVNAQAGARSGLAGLVTAAAVALTLLLLTPLFYYLPRGVLAAIIMTAVAGLVDLREARHLWRVSRPDLALMGLTFAATLALGIELGILTGVAASLLWFVWRMSAPHVALLGRLPNTTIYRDVKRYPEAVQTPSALALRVDAPLFFANTASLKRALAEHEAAMDAPLAHLVLSASAIATVDAQALSVLEEIIEAYRARGVSVWMAGVRGPVRDALGRARLTALIGPDRFVERVHEAIDLLLPCLRLAD